MKGLYVYSIMVAGSLLALVRNPALTAIPPDNRVLAEKSFETPQQPKQEPSQPALAYASPDSGVLDNKRKITLGPLLGVHSWTAVYDISAHTVYLPDGTKLEAHSGRGGRLDNPRYVQEHMRGATPPNVYELALREKAFHGVKALRLKPVGGGNTFGRSGLLAHTYMLGPKGESNGCVVFKNYNAFLHAFQNGEVRRLIVVDDLNARKGYELTLAQASFAPFAVIGPEQSLAPTSAPRAKLVCENQADFAAGREAARLALGGSSAAGGK